MKTVLNKLTLRATTEAPIYISRVQFEDAYYIPKEMQDRIIIVDFIKEEEDDTGTEDRSSK